GDELGEEGVAERGEGAGFVHSRDYSLHERPDHRVKSSSDRLRRQDYRICRHLAPARTGHPRPCRACVCVIDELDARHVPKHKAEPLWRNRCHDHDIGRTYAGDRRHSDFVEVRTKLTKQDLATAENELVTLNAGSVLPCVERNPSFRHVLEPNVWRFRWDLTWLHPPAGIVC